MSWVNTLTIWDACYLLKDQLPLARGANWNSEWTPCTNLRSGLFPIHDSTSQQRAISLLPL
jgi:hypothetical protein